MEKNNNPKIPEQNTPSEEQTPDSLAEMKDLLLRTQANFENYRKQTEKRIEDIKDFAAKDIILQILPILDELALALKNIDPKLSYETFVKGIELIYAHLIQLLEQHDIHPIPTEQQLFDPYCHEALMKVASDLPENTIIEEFQKGYTYHKKILRPARVKISAGKTKSEEKK